LKDEAIFGAPSWESSDPDVAKRLNDAGKPMKKVRKATQFEWRGGTEAFTHEWAVQIASVGDGQSVLILKAGNYGSSWKTKVGFEHLDLCMRELVPLLDGTQRPQQPPLYRPEFEALFRQHVLGDFEGAAVGPGGLGSYEKGILEIASRYAGDDVYVDDIPRDVEETAREHILADNAGGHDILALFDFGAGEPGEEGAAFTPYACYVRNGDDALEVGLFDIESVDGVKGLSRTDVVVRTREDGKVVLPCEHHAEAVADILGRFAKGAFAQDD
jgi:hypothetical protein